MAGAHHLAEMSREASIRATHAGVTLEALEALANKGLLRRAQKDYERGEVGAFEMSAAGLTVSVSGQRVTLIEAGPAKAACSCPAPGVCQHILAACIALMRSAGAAPATASSAHAEWLAFTHDDLIAAFGLPMMRAACELSLAHEAVIENGATLTVRFPALNAEIIALPGAGLGGVIVNGAGEKRHPQLAAAALLVVRREAGQHWEPPALKGDKSDGVPLHREDVLRAATALLEEMLAAGLARLSPAIVERLDALAISAQTAEWHRLGLLLQRLATQASDWLLRRPQADLGLLFSDMATAYALTHALGGNAPQLAGTSRENYAEVGSLDLVGVTAWPWRTASGYEGLTMLMWDPANATWATWTDARPRAFQGGFSAVSRFTQPGPWEGAASPAQLSRSRFRLLQARRNRWGRLSASTKCKALVTGTSSATAITCKAHDEWPALATTLAQSATLGLRERDPRAAYQIIAPASWERHPFDPVQQSLTWLLRDNGGHAIELRLAFDDLSRPAIQLLEKLSDDDFKGAKLLGRCLLNHGRVQIHPIALITAEKITSIFLSDAPAPAKAPPAAAPADSDDECDDAEPVPAAMTSALARLTFAAISGLEWLAESGQRARPAEALSRLDDLANQAAELRLPRLAALLQHAATPGEWLRVRWILSVIQRAETA
jgi:hypothetical protein